MINTISCIIVSTKFHYIFEGSPYQIVVISHQFHKTYNYEQSTVSFEVTTILNSHHEALLV
jgi:hypothetical protein